MSYPKKATSTRTQSVTNIKGNRLTEEKRERLLAIQQREQLKGMLVNKFLEKYGGKKAQNQDHINREVTDFLKNAKLTEENLKLLEQRIKDGPKPQVSQREEPQVKATSTLPPIQNQSQAQETAPHKSQVNFKRVSKDDDDISIASSTRPKSVYLQEDEDDEWATLLKYDAELFKKEKELEFQRNLEMKKKVKEELDRQILEKKRLQKYEDEDERAYAGALENQIKNYDFREKKKEDERKAKIMNEKYSRDKQLRDENIRKRQEQKAEKQMDELLVRKIKEEMEEQARVAAQRKEEERFHLRKVLRENEDYKKRLAEEAKREKDADIRAQQEYTRLVEQMEQKRAAEFKAREDRAKKLMSMMADTVIKDQKEQILEEERKLLRYHQERENRETQEERRRLEMQNQQKKEMRAFLDKQKHEKELRRQEEEAFNRKQAELWKKDTDDYNNQEKLKMDTIRDINKKNAEFLKQQIENERRKKGRKMDIQEALLNKDKLKRIAEIDGEKFHKTEVLV